MNQHRVQRSRLWLAAGLALSLLGTLPAQAQSFPTKPVKIVVPFGPGGVGDLTARAVAAKLADMWGQGVVIENRPGAGGVVAADTVAKSEPDGHTLFLMSNGTAVTQALFTKLPFNAATDFVPTSTLGYFDIAVVVGESSPHKTLGDLVKFAKANPGKVNVGTINVGSSQNLAAELFKSTAEIDVQVVPFKVTPALITAIRGDQVDVAIELLGPVLPQIQAKAMRALAVTGERRSIAIPDVPTAKESGIDGFVASSWNALAAPAKTPRAVIDRLSRDINTALSDAEVKQRLQKLNVDARGSTPEQASSLLLGDIKRWGSVIEKAGIPKQ